VACCLGQGDVWSLRLILQLPLCCCRPRGTTRRASKVRITRRSPQPAGRGLARAPPAGETQDLTVYSSNLAVSSRFDQRDCTNAVDKTRASLLSCWAG